MSDQAENQDLALRRFRDYLSALAQVQVDPRLRGKLDLSGVAKLGLVIIVLSRYMRRGQPA